MIDLHCHSHFSDGLHSPEALATLASQQSLRVLALTDHDSIEGWAEMARFTAAQGIQFIPGIEFSTRWKKHDIHILGLRLQSCADLLAALEIQQARRKERALQIGDLLAQIGIQDAYQACCARDSASQIGRLHYARLLVERGLVQDQQSAFTRYLGRGKPAYVPTDWIGVDEAVAVIRAAGGVPVVAHPLKYGLTRTKLIELLKFFKEAGGMGMEVVSGIMQSHEIMAMATMARQLDLLASSGSDFHGKGLSRLSLGCQPPLPSGCKPVWQLWDIEQQGSV